MAIHIKSEIIISADFQNMELHILKVCLDSVVMRDFLIKKKKIFIIIIFLK